jgi:hypothetical protein
MANLRELRRLVGDTSGDVLVLRATEDSANTTSFTDYAHLGDRGDRSPSIVNRLLYLSEATVDTQANLQHSAAATDFSSLTRTVTFSPGAPLAPKAGDVAELWSVAERIGSIDALHRLINYAIDQVKDIAGPEEYTAPAKFLLRDGSLPIPATWAYFGGAEWLDGRDFPSEVRSRYIKVIPGQRQVRIWGSGAERADRKNVRLYGYLRCTPLVREDDATPVSTEWIVESVSEALTLARSWASNDAAAAERRANFWAGRAALYRRSAMSGRRGLGIALL